MRSLLALRRWCGSRLGTWRRVARFEPASNSHQLASTEVGFTGLGIPGGAVTMFRVILNLAHNPDGHERFTVWYNSVSVGSPDPRAQEHDEPWSVYGRFNHYRFDMNRDLIASTQREVQGIMRMMLKWHPMVAADLHGHVSTYFFPPAARPVNANIVGVWEVADLFGRANAAASTGTGGSTSRATSTTCTIRLLRHRHRSTERSA
jgi:hypothetical protein